MPTHMDVEAAGELLCGFSQKSKNNERYLVLQCCQCDLSPGRDLCY